MSISAGSDSYISLSKSSNIGFINIKILNSEINVGIEIEFTRNNGDSLESRGNYLYFRNTQLAFSSSSSRRYKDCISSLTAESLDPHRLYNLSAVQFEYITDHPLQYADMKGQTLPGFIAEDVAEIYPAAVIHGADGQVESWDERRIIPGLLALVQEQKQEIDALTARVEKLERLVAGLVD